MRIEVSFHDRLEIVMDREQPAQKQSSFRLVDVGSEMGQFMLLGEIQIEGWSFVQRLTVWGD